MATKTRSVGVPDERAATSDVASKASLDGAQIEKTVRWLTLGLTAALSALAWPMFHREFFAYGDLKNCFTPHRYRLSEALHSGDSFLWEPLIYCGTYIYSQGDLAGSCHPFQWLLYRTFPFDVAFNLEFLLNYGWLFLGTFFLLWHWRLPRGAALFGALVFTLGERTCSTSCTSRGWIRFAACRGSFC